MNTSNHNQKFLEKTLVPLLSDEALKHITSEQKGLISTIRRTICFSNCFELGNIFLCLKTCIDSYWYIFVVVFSVFPSAAGDFLGKHLHEISCKKIAQNVLEKTGNYFTRKIELFLDQKNSNKFRNSTAQHYIYDR